ncbi:Endothelin-converting enzyme 1 [Desmophyllum pertusum]|uniref:Endothelin-converting enzyme 1 n=1 Tax=Desmophyllum pertusum TaxID=174260 RepID=A0A9X0A4F3_9CNID|nr:Endothelin-converting enzyme 1 [Desmophyllum pertusum]
MYDKDGNYGVMWWTNKSVEQYKLRSDCMVKQYSQFSYFNKHVNGKVTLGENIADNGGLKAAYNAYKEWEKKNGAEPPLPLLNMTADQTFFMAFAQSWCANIREQAAIVRLDDDPHSPNKFRVLGSVSNLDAFSTAFKCPSGSKMNPPHKCHIW